jgi:hypothetical protein
MQPAKTIPPTHRKGYRNDAQKPSDGHRAEIRPRWRVAVEVEQNPNGLETDGKNQQPQKGPRQPRRPVPGSRINSQAQRCFT